MAELEFRTCIASVKQAGFGATAELMIGKLPMTNGTRLYLGKQERREILVAGDAPHRVPAISGTAD